jgi:hypothetical protein
MDLDRAQINMAVGVFVFFATLTAGALVFILLDQAYDPIITTANTSSYANNSSRLTTGIDRATLLWQNWAFFDLVLAAILGIVAAAYSSRGAR